MALDRALEPVLHSLPECFVGARPRTQTLDIAHGLQTIIEKGLDDIRHAHNVMLCTSIWEQTPNDITTMSQPLCPKSVLKPITV